LRKERKKESFRIMSRKKADRRAVKIGSGRSKEGKKSPRQFLTIGKRSMSVLWERKKSLGGRFRKLPFQSIYGGEMANELSWGCNRGMISKRGNWISPIGGRKNWGIQRKLQLC